MATSMLYHSAGQDVAGLKRHVSAIAAFLRQHAWLWRAHVVDFFRVNLWARLEEQWNQSLRIASVENLLLLPSGVVQEEWPESLKEFVRTAFQLSLSRLVDASSDMSYSGVPQAPISIVLGQGMSVKKLHEIGILAALIAHTAKLRGAKDVIDVGAGQGYLALVLAFEYRLSVIAVDACAHHADVTNKRALRIQKHYNGRSRKLQQEGLRHPDVRAPQTVTCRVGSGGESPASLSSLLPAIQESTSSSSSSSSSEVSVAEDRIVQDPEEVKDCSVVLAGLHACGDLSATMLRTFVECKEVAAVINVGCCYNLLSDEASNDITKEVYGFPMSATVGKLGLHLGRSVRDLACQSAERWKEHHPTRAIQNFELHAFRAAFQLLLGRHYPETANNSPSVGRAGKSRRRRQARQSAMNPLFRNNNNDDDTSSNSRPFQTEPREPEGMASIHGEEDEGTCTTVEAFEEEGSLGRTNAHALSSASICNNIEKKLSRSGSPAKRGVEFEVRSSLEQQAARFEEYARVALERLNLAAVPSSALESLWMEVAPHQDLVGPFYAVRAALAPVIESYILLDRLLYLKEQAQAAAAATGGRESMTAELVPLFEPSISPRNMAIIAHRHFEHPFGDKIID